MNIYPEVPVEAGLPIGKPANPPHFGVLRNGFDSTRAVGTLDRRGYDLFLNRIAEGAAYGGSAAQRAQ